MRCERCRAELPLESRFCPACGAAAPAEEPPADRSITSPETRPGAWHWLLLVLLLAERVAACYAFPLNDLDHPPAAWERLFLHGWGWGLFLLAAPFLVLRRRAGGWLAALSSLALIGRDCVPLLGEAPAAGAVVVLIVTSATLTFAFLHEQSYWPRSEP